MAPPNTSEAVTGAASRIVWLTLRRLVNEVPSERSMTSRFRNSRVLDRDGPVEPESMRGLRDHGSVARWPQASRAGFAGMM